MNTLVTSSLRGGDVHLLLSFPKELISENEKRIVSWIESYLSRYSQPPTVERLCEQFDTFIPQDSPDPLGDVYERTLTKKRNRYARKYLMEIQDKLKNGEDPLPFIEELHGKIRTGGSDVSLYSTFDRSVYHRRPTAYPYDIPLLDTYTGGISQGDLIYLIGRLGVGKTSVALWVVTRWLMNQRKVLMISNENRADDVIAKIDSFIGGFNPIKKRTMNWTSEDLHRLNTVSYIAKNLGGEMFIPNQPVKDVAQIRSLIYTHQPDIVVVDGIYLMSGAKGDSHWEKITNISRELKQTAEGEGVPLLGIHQASRSAIGKRIEIEHIAYADALAQDADLVLGINPEEDGTLFVEAIKNRWGKDSWGFYLKIAFDTMTVRITESQLEPEEEAKVK